MPCKSALFLQSGEQKNPNCSRHCGQIGLPQTEHFSVASTPRCRWQYLDTGAAGGGSAGFSPDEIFSRGAAGAAGSGLGMASGKFSAISARTSWLTYSDESSPQLGQTKRTGL